MSRHAPLRVGKIPYTNLFPIFRALEYRLPPGEVQFVTGHPADLNRMLRDGRLDVSPSSSIEYALSPGSYRLCPGISIASRARVMSVVLLSNMPLSALPDEPVAVTGRSDSSVVLLEILLRESLGRRNALVRTSLPPSDALLRHPAYLAIGDEAIRSTLEGTAPHVTDLGEWWRRETGTPFVFALWIVSRAATLGREDSVLSFASTLLEAKRDALAEIGRVGDGPPPGPSWIPADFLREYWRNLSYNLDGETKGLELFFRMAHGIGRIPAVPRLDFLEIPERPRMVQSGRSVGRAAMRIHKDMKIEDVLRNFPQTIPVFQRFGIDCAECHLSEYENLEQGAKVHKIDLETLLRGLNETVREG